MCILINILSIFVSLILTIIWAEQSSTSISGGSTLVNVVQHDENTLSNSVTWNPIGHCTLVCLNNGTCRLDDNIKSKPYCVCTPDFKGVDCSEETEADLTTCEESTCKYGGMCVGTTKAPRCLCKENTRGKRCERHDLVYGVEMKMYENGVEAVWSTDYEKESSSMSMYSKKAMDVCKLLRLSIAQGPDAWLSSSFIDCILQNYKYGSVIITVNLVLDIPLNMLRNISSDVVEQQIIIGLQKLNPNLEEFKAISLADIIGGNSLAFKLYAIDPCTNGNHDCSTNAKCISQPQGTYECLCNAFTVDASMDANFPGRRCLYDGLIIFAFAIIGCLICTFTVLICGCRRTIWRRYRNGPESIDLINMPRNYDI
ncbi:unnamed protein product [Heterobilharzia americana]|nr:unnamed protein product [Heterobilharzia americana]